MTMNKKRLALGFGVLLFFALSALPAAHAQRQTVDRAPPAPQAEQVPAARQGFVWVDGHWVWNGYQWQWQNGHWERAKAGYVWQPGHWEQQGNVWVWIPGEWVKPQAQLPIPRELKGARVRVIATHSGKCLDVEGGGTGDGTKIHQWACHQGANQQWDIVPVDDVFVELRAAHSGKCLDVSGASMDNGAAAHQWKCLGPRQSNQHWRFVPMAGGYQLIAQHDGKCLDVRGVAKDDGTPYQQWDCVGAQQLNQIFRVEPVPPAPPPPPGLANSLVSIVASHSGKCVDVEGGNRGDGTKVIQWACNGQQNQQWTLRPTRDGYFEIVAKHSGKCLDVEGVSYQNGGKVHQWRCAGQQQANQHWRFVPVNGGYQIVAQHSGKCLDVRGVGREDGVVLQQWDCVGPQQQNQVFQVINPPPVQVQWPTEVTPGLRGELETLLAVAAAHASYSRHCSEGLGRKLEASLISAAVAGPQDGMLAVDITYRVSYELLDGAIDCAAYNQQSCPRCEARTTQHSARVFFARNGNNYRMQLPGILPGLKGAPLDRNHDGQCFGRSGAFRPRNIQVP